MKLNWNKNYFLAFIVLFLIEVGIAIFVKDSFISPYFGDFLVVILVYCFVKIFLKTPKYTVAVSSFLFCCLVEFIQIFKLGEVSSFADNK
ncbi:MAG: hypothetical protein ACI9XR_001929 [Flavobacterium sp.]|jgi:hypothetical protein